MIRRQKKGELTRLTFALPLDGHHGAVSVVGDFNDWTPGTHTLVKRSNGTRSTGQGRIEPDGSLYLVQQVFDDGKPPHERRWRVRQVGPGRYTGTMTEASGPVTIDRLGDRFRFSFRMNGRLNVEQMLTPLPGGRSATNNAKIRRFGMVVATTEGIVRKL